jgi:hypothetical protein
MLLVLRGSRVRVPRSDAAKAATAGAAKLLDAAAGRVMRAMDPVAVVCVAAVV